MGQRGKGHVSRPLQQSWGSRQRDWIWKWGAWMDIRKPPACFPSPRVTWVPRVSCLLYLRNSWNCCYCTFVIDFVLSGKLFLCLWMNLPQEGHKVFFTVPARSTFFTPGLSSCRCCRLTFMTFTTGFLGSVICVSEQPAFRQKGQKEGQGLFPNFLSPEWLLPGHIPWFSLQLLIR